MPHIPRLMCTQHPDATIKVAAGEEVDEAVVAFSVYGCDEVMVDYEGKSTPFTQPKDIVVRAHMSGLVLGKELFLTPRVPNPTLEDVDRTVLAIDAAIMANHASYRYWKEQAVKWIVLPMSDPNTVALIQRLISRKTNVVASELGIRLGNISLVPLLEDVDAQLRVRETVSSVFRELAKLGFFPDHMRIFLGKSDSAVLNGHVASSLAIVYALDELNFMSQNGEFPIEPILGMGKPPFRGGINSPELADVEAAQYAGYSTVTVQSAIRYDSSFDEYLRFRNSVVPPRRRREAAVGDVRPLIERASRMYRRTIQKYLDAVREVSRLVPSTRDRVSWEAYGRAMKGGESFRLPRAIVFTCSWYMMGLPPTMLDAPLIVSAYRNGGLDAILDALPSLQHEWRFDARFLDVETARRFLGDELVDSVLASLDIMGIRDYGYEPYTSLLRGAQGEANVIALGKLRKFLG